MAAVLVVQQLLYLTLFTTLSKSLNEATFLHTR